MYIMHCACNVSIQCMFINATHKAMQVMWTLALQHHPTAGTHEATSRYIGPHAGEITLLLRSSESSETDTHTSSMIEDRHGEDRQ